MRSTASGPGIAAGQQGGGDGGVEADERRWRGGAEEKWRLALQQEAGL